MGGGDGSVSGRSHLGVSSCVYPLEAGDLLRLPDPPEGTIPADALPGDVVLLYIRPDGPDALLRGRARLEAAVAAEGARAVVPVRVVFKPSIPRWRIVTTLVRVLRNRHRYRGTGVYHIDPAAVRALGLERATRTLEHPQRRKGVDRAAKMRILAESLRRNGYDDAKPICVQVCRVGGRVDSLHQGHHRVSACLACGVGRMAVRFSAAGALPRILGGRGV